MTKNRHELPRKRPGRSAKDEIAEDLPTLEPVNDDLPTLAPVDDDDVPTLEAVDEVDEGPVKVTCVASTEAAFDTIVGVEVPAMDKKAVPDAVKAPLARACATNTSRLRHRRVLVRFTGEAMIGSAVKDLVAETIKPHKPLLAIVKRGFGDETVAQGKAPEVAVKAADADGTTRVEVATGELDAIDLPIALAAHLPTLLAAARGKRVAFAFTGKAKPDSALRAQLTKDLQDRGALRAAIGERVLFDKELADRVRCTTAGDTVTLAVQVAGDDAATLDALAMVLPEHAAAPKGKTVRIELSKPNAAARDAGVDFARKNGASRIEVGGEIVWPKVVTLASGAETTLRVAANGRSRPQVLAALRAEAAEHAAACKGKPVVLDWPAGFALDAEAVACVREVAKALGCKALLCTVAGEQREPFVPEPVAFATAGDVTTLRLDSEAGKPVELQRAIDRALPAKVGELRGKSVRVQVVGGAALSRTLLRGVCGALEAAGAMRLEVEEGGTVDVLAPVMLTVTRVGDVVRIAAMTAGRDEAQQKKALARELDAAGLAATETVMVGQSAAAEALVAAAIQKGVARVVLDGKDPVQVYPALLGVPEKKLPNVRIAVAAGDDAAMVARQLERELPAWSAGLPSFANQTVTLAWANASPNQANVDKLLAAVVAKKPMKVMLAAGSNKPVQLHPPVAAPVAAVTPDAPAAVVPAAPVASAATPVASEAAAPVAIPAGNGTITLLGRSDAAVPPMIILGVTNGATAEHIATVQAELTAHLPRFRGRSVLLVLRDGDRDVPVRKADALVDMLRQQVPSTAAATLVFRGPDAQGRPHFQVLHSTLRALPIGGTFADPRARKTSTGGV